MKKKIIKLIVFVIIVLQISNISLPIFAVSNVNVGDSVTLYSKKTLDSIVMEYYGQPLTMYYTVYSDGKNEYPVYCVDYFHGGITADRTYNVQITENYVYENIDASIEENERKLGVWRAIINGYPFVGYKALNCEDCYEAYAATKQAVFCMLYNRDVTLYTYEGEEGKRVYDAMVSIVNNARASSKIPESITINLTESDWQVDDVNNEFLSKKITLNCETAISNYTVLLEGNVPNKTIIADLQNNELTEFNGIKEFKVLVPLENLTEKDEFKINVNANVISYPMYFGQAPSSSLQSYVLTAGRFEISSASSLIQYPENQTKLIIKKQDDNGNFLSGVKFNILNVDKEVIYKNISTDENGIVEINNMIPGKYYLQEIETLEGYEINNELIEIDLVLNEIKEIKIENTKIPEVPKIPEEPKIPEIPTIPDVIQPIVLETPKLPRTGY